MKKIVFGLIFTIIFIGKGLCSYKTTLDGSISSATVYPAGAWEMKLRDSQVTLTISTVAVNEVATGINVWITSGTISSATAYQGGSWNITNITSATAYQAGNWTISSATIYQGGDINVNVSSVSNASFSRNVSHTFRAGGRTRWEYNGLTSNAQSILTSPAQGVDTVPTGKVWYITDVMPSSIKTGSFRLIVAPLSSGTTIYEAVRSGGQAPGDHFSSPIRLTAGQEVNLKFFNEDGTTGDFFCSMYYLEMDN